jgi:hypothetical protein
LKKKLWCTLALSGLFHFQLAHAQLDPALQQKNAAETSVDKDRRLPPPRRGGGGGSAPAPSRPSRPAPPRTSPSPSRPTPPPSRPTPPPTRVERPMPRPTNPPTRVERPRPTTPPTRVERPRPTTPPTRVERPRPTTPPTRVERPRPTTPPTRVERPRPTTPPTRVERPRPTTPPTRVERPRPTTPPTRVERPGPSRPMPPRVGRPLPPRIDTRPAPRRPGPVLTNRSRVHRDLRHRPRWFESRPNYRPYRHTVYNNPYANRVRFLRPNLYHRTLPYSCLYAGRWVMCRSSIYNDGYYTLGGYPYFVYNGYQYRYSSYDTCQYDLVDGDTNTVAQRSPQGLSCNRAYDLCATNRDNLNSRYSRYKYFCAESFQYERGYNYNWNPNDDFYSDIDNNSDSSYEYEGDWNNDNTYDDGNYDDGSYNDSYGNYPTTGDATSVALPTYLTEEEIDFEKSYELSVTRTQFVTVEVYQTLGQTGNLDFMIYDQRGSLIGRADSNRDIETLTINLNPGRYTVKVLLKNAQSANTYAIAFDGSLDSFNNVQ